MPNNNLENLKKNWQHYLYPTVSTFYLLVIIFFFIMTARFISGQINEAIAPATDEQVGQYAEPFNLKDFETIRKKLNLTNTASWTE